MTKPLPWSGRIALLSLLPAALLPLLFAAPRASVPVRPAAQFQASRFHDWTTRFAVYPHNGTMAALEAAEKDPRARFRWREFEEQERLVEKYHNRHEPPPRWLSPTASGLHRDWSISLGTSGTAPAMYPAKFTFNVTAAPSCANDFVVFPVNAAGTAAQPNLVALNNLYSGTANGTTPDGFCNTVTAATVTWAYNVDGIGGAAATPTNTGGAATTSPVLSLDGTKVAFVESATGSTARFHVVAYAAEGTVAAPVIFGGSTGRAFSTTAPVASGGKGAATDMALGSSTTGTDTLSSPYVDYANDLAYVGNDLGVLYRIKNVFCTVSAACSGATPPAPSLDPSWGTSGALTIGGTCTGTSAKLTAPVLDFYNLVVYVGCSDGKLYSISQSGTINSLVVGDGVASKTFGGIVDPPIVDGVNGFVYAVSGSANSGANGVLVQAKANFSSSVAVPIGAGNQCNIHAPALSNAYFTSPTAAGSLIYIGGVTGTVGPCTAAGATGGKAVLYGATFGTGGVLNSGAPANSLTSGNSVGSEYAPIGEFFNSNIGTGEDTLFVSLLRNNSDGYNNLYSFNITTGWSATVQNDVTEGLGASGIIVDNDANTATYAQSSSIYFNALNENATCTSPQTGTNTGGCAVKLTQAGLD
jgi:hypothetical protein